MSLCASLGLSEDARTFSSFGNASLGVAAVTCAACGGGRRGGLHAGPEVGFAFGSLSPTLELPEVRTIPLDCEWLPLVGVDPMLQRGDGPWCE